MLEKTIWNGGFLRKVAEDLKHHTFPLDYLFPWPLVEKKNLGLKQILMGLLSVEFRLVLSYRIQNHLWNFGKKKIAYLWYLHAKRKYKCDIYPSAVIGAGLRIGHCSDIVIGPDVVIGSYALIFNAVTLGNSHLVMKNNMPNAGDFVIFGTGCKVLGSIFVGNKVTIGANSVVVKSVPDSVVVAGVPAKIIRNI